jgi:DNA-binding beta-propeller fold protein YncE
MLRVIAVLLACLAAAPALSQGGASSGSSVSTVSSVSSGAAPFRFGPYVGAIEGLGEPSDCAFGPDGRLYVLERTADRVSVFTLTPSPAGGPLRAERQTSFGSFGGGEGQFRSPQGLAVSSDGLIAVADTGNHRVQLFDQQGGFLRQWGELGVQRTQFNRPQGITLDESWVYVADTGNDRVLVFDRSGSFVTQLGGVTGRGGLDREDALSHPEDVATDGGNLVFIADTDANRISVFDKSARFVRRWGDFGGFGGLMDQPTGVALSGGALFVADSRNHRIDVFDAEGRLLREWGAHARMPREGAGRLHYPRRIAFEADGSMAAIAEPFEDRVQLFRALSAGEREAPRQPIPPDEQTHFGRALAIDGELLAIPQPEVHDVAVFDLRGPSPVMITRFGERGRAFGQFVRATGVAVDGAARRVQVADEALARIQSFRLSWDDAAPVKFVPLMTRFVRSLRCSTDAGPFARARWPMRPSQIRRDARGRLHVVDTRNRMVFVYDAAMVPLLAYGGAAAGPGELLEPVDASLSAPGDLFFVADAGRREVVAFDPRGKFMLSFGAGKLERPAGITSGVDGFVYVTDEARCSILKFTETGKFVAEWGSRGSADGQLWKPAGIVQRPDGQLYVVDWGNHRAQVFSAEGAWLMTFGGGRVSTREAPRKPDQPFAQQEE